jgi:hypothetical protein
LDFSKIAYITDTGRRWDGDSVSVRDKVCSRKDLVGSVGVSGYRGIGVSATTNQQTATSNQYPATSNSSPKYRSTHEMIKAIKEGRFPVKAMLTIHPQRWHDRPVPWVRELVWQNVKNVGKYILVKIRR